ncbi:uncharacterized protein LOC143231655 isoform X3 [Tachypleus tridentatus]|uniref:uncharacterized protein LOC143231655 isoform X3 n=1 Tax=Tachypleus tridentatus TaxID=6853 RepID=UPI003FD65225
MKNEENTRPHSFSERSIRMLEVETFRSMASPSSTASTPGVVRRHRTRLSSVPLVDLRNPDEKHYDGGIISRSHPTAIGTQQFDSGHLKVYPRTRGGMCSMSDTMENLRVIGNSPLPSKSRMKSTKRSPEGTIRFPKLNECAHFHYEHIELGPITAELCDKRPDSSKVALASANSPDKENESSQWWFYIKVSSNGRSWVIRRTYENFRMLDKQLHRCVYDRKFSVLQELPAGENLPDESAMKQLDNRGNRLIVTDEAAINTPAIAAVYVIKRYTAQATDEISFEVGDMISVIDMPPPEESTWWRGKRGFEVGFFPSECVEVIGQKIPRSLTLPSSATKPVLRKQGKLIAFFRQFLLSRPPRGKLKQSGILKERVFGCDLGEHLLNTSREIPLVLKCCAEFIEEHGIVNGIYRLSGVNSNIQKLRLVFDEDRTPNLNDEAILHDIHCVASLLKMYFRELPNPLLTYQLYEQFVTAIQTDDDIKLIQIRDVVQQLPPPHYRTLEYLMRHLSNVASWGNQTGMTPKNVAIVWAPNLLRCKEMETGSGVGALHVVGVQAILTEYLIRYVDLIFREKLPDHLDEEEMSRRPRSKSFTISSPTKLLSLEEARTKALALNLPVIEQKYIEVGGGPDQLPSKYHAMIDLPFNKRNGTKLKKSPSGWKSFFSRGSQSGNTSEKDDSQRGSLKNYRKGSTGSLQHTRLALQDKAITETKKLRTVRSAESFILSTPGGGSCRSSSVIESFGSVEGIQQLHDKTLEPNSYSQKHVRSSSHESYFEHGSVHKILPGDSTIEDSNTINLVKTRLETLDKFPDSDESLTSFEHVYDSYMDSDTFVNFDSSRSLQSTSSPLEEAKDSSQEYSSNSYKVARKQKLISSDSDVSSPKVQKLSFKRFRQAFSSPSFDRKGHGSCKDSKKDSKWTCPVKDRDTLRGSFRKTKEKIFQVLTPDSVHKKLYPGMEGKSGSPKSECSESDVSNIHQESNNENVEDQNVKESSCLEDFKNDGESTCKETVNMCENDYNLSTESKEDESVTVEIHAFDSCLHIEDDEAVDDSVNVVNEMLQAVAKKIEEENERARNAERETENSRTENSVEKGISSGSALLEMPLEVNDRNVEISKIKPATHLGEQGNFSDSTTSDKDTSSNLEMASINKTSFLYLNKTEELNHPSCCDKKYLVCDVSQAPTEQPTKPNDIYQEQTCAEEQQSETNIPLGTDHVEFVCKECTDHDDFGCKVEDISTSEECNMEEVDLKNITSSQEPDLENIITPNLFHQTDFQEASCQLQDEVSLETVYLDEQDETVIGGSDEFISGLNIINDKNETSQKNIPELKENVECKPFSKNGQNFLEMSDFPARSKGEGKNIRNYQNIYKSAVDEEKLSMVHESSCATVIDSRILRTKNCDLIPSNKKEIEFKKNTCGFVEFQKSPWRQNGRLYKAAEKMENLDMSSLSFPESVESSMVHSYPRGDDRAFKKNIREENAPIGTTLCTEHSPRTYLTSKSSQPSLFTQLKVLKLQAFQSPESTKETVPYDPWSDPILDSVVDPQDVYEKQIFSPAYKPLTSKDNVDEVNSNISSDLSVSNDRLEGSKLDDPVNQKEPVIQKQTTGLNIVSSSSKHINKTTCKEPESVKKLGLEDLPKIGTLVSHPADGENVSVPSLSAPLLPHLPSDRDSVTADSETVRRERINRYKEERRAQLRERWQSESFKKEIPDKKHTGTRWRSSIPLSRTVTSPDDPLSSKVKRERSQSSGTIGEYSQNQKESKPHVSDEELE